MYIYVLVLLPVLDPLPYKSFISKPVFSGVNDLNRINLGTNRCKRFEPDLFGEKPNLNSLLMLEPFIWAF